MKINKNIFLALLGIGVLVTFGFSKATKKSNTIDIISQDSQQVAYFAGGCFWCVEAVFESVYGVEEAVSGYAGGHSKKPTYASTGKGDTGHAETVAVYYNPKKVSFKTLVDVYYGSHNPVTVNGQHPDFGSQYRSIAFYKNDTERKIIESKITQINKGLKKGKVATEVTKFTKFFKAEKYHQNFVERNPNQRYVKAVSIPRLNDFKKKFPNLLKEVQ